MDRRQCLQQAGLIQVMGAVFFHPSSRERTGLEGIPSEGAAQVWVTYGCLPLCRVCLPPESTPLGSMPVGVRPFSVSTLSLSSLQGIHRAAILLYLWRTKDSTGNMQQQNACVPLVGPLDLLLNLEYATSVYTCTGVMPSVCGDQVTVHSPVGSSARLPIRAGPSSRRG